jgi:hypothetical protein
MPDLSDTREPRCQPTCALGRSGRCGCRGRLPSAAGPAPQERPRRAYYSLPLAGRVEEADGEAEEPEVGGLQALLPLPGARKKQQEVDVRARVAVGGARPLQRLPAALPCLVCRQRWASGPGQPAASGGAACVRCMLPVAERMQLNTLAAWAVADRCTAGADRRACWRRSEATAGSDSSADEMGMAASDRRCPRAHASWVLPLQQLLGQGA